MEAENNLGDRRTFGSPSDLLIWQLKRTQERQDGKQYQSSGWGESTREFEVNFAKALDPAYLAIAQSKPSKETKKKELQGCGQLRAPDPPSGKAGQGQIGTATTAPGQGLAPAAGPGKGSTGEAKEK